MTPLKKGMHLSYTPSPSSEAIDILTQRINQESVGFGAAYPFAFFIKNDAGAMLAGCNGSIVFGSIYTDQLWVHPQHRKSGLGRVLMEHVHAHGLATGCSMATVSTMCFQGAQEFYEKLGYTVDFIRSGYAHASCCIFLKRSL